MSMYFEKIIELRNQGKTYKEICNELNCAMSTVSYHCKLNKMGGHSDRLTDEQKMGLQKLYDEIGNLKKVAKIKGHAYETVRKYVTWNKKNKKITRSESVIEWRKRTKMKLVEYKGGKCQFCGYNRCIKALDFHHINPLEKEFELTSVNRKWDTLRKEADKCLMLCSNCHREIHEEIQIGS